MIVECGNTISTLLAIGTVHCTLNLEPIIIYPEKYIDNKSYQTV